MHAMTEAEFMAQVHLGCSWEHLGGLIAEFLRTHGFHNVAIYADKLGDEAARKPEDYESFGTFDGDYGTDDHFFDGGGI